MLDAYQGHHHIPLAKEDKDKVLLLQMGHSIMWFVFQIEECRCYLSETNG